MSDMVRNLIERCRYHGIGKEIDDLLAALDAERAEHAKEVADLKQRISELEVVSSSESIQKPKEERHERRNP